MEDSKIVELIYEREEFGLEELKKKYHNLLLGLSMSILKNKFDSEECVSDTYIKVWDHIPPYKPQYLKSFISKITRQISIDKYRANNHIRENENTIEDFECFVSAPHLTDEEFQETELVESINNFLKNIEPVTQVLFIRRYFMGESVTELSKKFKMNENIISVRLNRTRKKLKKYLEKEGYKIEKN